jgi:hypothetical protein
MTANIANAVQADCRHINPTIARPPPDSHLHPRVALLQFVSRYRPLGKHPCQACFPTALPRSLNAGAERELTMLSGA